MHKMGSDDCVAKEESERDHTEKGAQTQRSNLGQTLKGNLTSHKHRYFKVSGASDNYFETYVHISGLEWSDLYFQF